MRPLRSDGVNDRLQERPIMDPEAHTWVDPIDANQDIGLAADAWQTLLVGAFPLGEAADADDIRTDRIGHFSQAEGEDELDDEAYTARPRDTGGPYTGPLPDG